MRARLEQYLESLFFDVADTVKNKEMKDEVIQNTLDRFDDAVAEGMSEEAAFNLAVGAMGDVRELLEQADTDVRAVFSEEASENKGNKGLFWESFYRVLTVLLWTGTLLLYLGLSLLSKAWHITWLLVPISFSFHRLLRAVFDWIGGRKNEKK